MHRSFLLLFALLALLALLPFPFPLLLLLLGVGPQSLSHHHTFPPGLQLQGNHAYRAVRSIAQAFCQCKISQASKDTTVCSNQRHQGCMQCSLVCLQNVDLSLCLSFPQQGALVFKVDIPWLQLYFPWLPAPVLSSASPS